uniref:Chloride channel CLIC-like protein 1 n=1 Tax=Plectus sambesii TaxID=2011161 RepID=A0A914VC83_9BILA
MHGSRREDHESTCRSDSEVANLKSALSTCQQEASSCSMNPTLLKHVVNRLLIRFNLEKKLNEQRESDYIYTVNLHFSPNDIRTLQRFSDTDVPDMNLIKDAKLAMDTFFNKIHSIQATDEEPTFWEKFWTNLPFYVTFGNFVLLLPAAALVLRHIFRTSLLHSFLYLILIIFLFSCVGTWLRLYQEKLAERQRRYMEFEGKVPKECFPDQQSTFKAIYSSVSSYVSFQQPDKCFHYYKDIGVDPYLEVGVMDAVVDTAALAFLRPLGLWGEHLAKFIEAFYSRLPLTIAPLATVLLLILMLFFMILCGLFLLLVFGYRIKLPMFLGIIEPAHVPVVHLPQAVNTAHQQQHHLPADPLQQQQQQHLPATHQQQEQIPAAPLQQQQIAATQKRRRDFHRSVSLPHVSDADW